MTSSGIQRQCELVPVGVWKNDHLLEEVVLHSVPQICEPLANPSIQSVIEAYPQFHHLEWADPEVLNRTQPLVLIGLDYYWEFISGETIRAPDGPVAIHSKLGWILSGFSRSCDEEEGDSTALMTHTLRVSKRAGNDQVLERQLRAFWDLESLGIVDNEEDLFDQFRKVVEFKEGLYEIMLPWKDPTVDLPNNYELSLKRLRSLLRRLSQSPELRQKYLEVFREQERMGIIERVSNPDIVTIDRVHYLPHHPVVRSDHTTTKVQVVFDASARANVRSFSLNECLHIGLKFNQKILDILIRFRAHTTAFVADIEKAFLISVNPKDRDVLRFIWTDNFKEPSDIQVYRFTRVVFGVSCSPFLLNVTLRHYLEGYQDLFPSVIDSLKDSIYVDDVVTGADDPRAAYQLYRQSKKILEVSIQRLTMNV